MSNTGVWTKAELDDEGNFVVNIHAAAEWKEGETVTVGEDITKQLPEGLVNQLNASLNSIIVAGEKLMMQKARDAAIEMANFKLGKNRNKLTLDFTGALKQDGKVSTS